MSSGEETTGHGEKGCLVGAGLKVIAFTPLR